jgi:hypothetical protein
MNSNWLHLLAANGTEARIIQLELSVVFVMHFALRQACVDRSVKKARYYGVRLKSRCTVEVISALLPLIAELQEEQYMQFGTQREVQDPILGKILLADSDS